MRWRLEGRGWRCAYAIWELAEQLNAVWPQGGATDGTIGDAAHSARVSDHNPRDISGYVVDIVFAIDVHETVEGQGQQLVDALVASRDPRIRYIIHESRIWRSYNKPSIPAWAPGVYTGTNSHSNHVHVSIDHTSDIWDWRGRAWNLGGIEGGSMKELVAELQAALIAAGANLGDFPPLDDRFPPGADGVMGPATRAALAAGLQGGEHTHQVGPAVRGGVV